MKIIVTVVVATATQGSILIITMGIAKIPGVVRTATEINDNC
jgi:hypothetical protein